MRPAVVGHVELVTFARVDRVPAPGEIVHASSSEEMPAGGGPVAAVQLAKLAGGCTFFTALGDDPDGHRCLRELERLGLRVHAAFRTIPQRRAFTFIDSSGERTIAVLGDRLGPRGDDDLPWHELDDCDAVYFCAGDDDALRRARQASVLVATSRESERLARVRLPLDAVVGSARDPSEVFVPFDPPPGLIVATEGRRGGTIRFPDGRVESYESPSPEVVVDAYGAGDNFAAGLTFGLAAGLAPADAVRLAARCGSASLEGHGPYAAQATADSVRPGMFGAA